jgi:hypothetical protein
MKNSIIKTSISILLCFFITGLKAQQFKQFSGKPETFTAEALVFLGQTKDDELKNIYKTFSYNWDSAKFDNTEKDKILILSKCLVDKKIRSIPEFYYFLRALNTFLKQGHSRTSFAQWLDALCELCTNKKFSLSAMNRLIDHTYDLLTENLIYQSPSLTWKPGSHSFYYKFDGKLCIVFDKTDLVCYSKRDSIKIFNTSGEFLPTELRWNGTAGLVTWERAGYDRNTISAQLTNYSIDLMKSSYEADSVIFTNKSYFDFPLVGHLEDNVTLITDSSLALYPRFDSYKKHFVIRNLYQNVDYEGGFSMQGAKLVGKGSIENPARLNFFRKDTLKLKTTSLYFIFRPERVIGVNSSVCIYLDKDSIFHGDVQFTYTIRNKEVSLVKSENYSAQSPYLNTYHGIDMNFEQLNWRIDEPMVFLTITPGSSIGRALFESKNFFNTKEYSELQYYDEIHPLVALKKYAQKIGSNKFSAEDFSAYMKKSIDQTRVLLFPLSVKGYIIYNSATETIEIKPRLFDNIKANMGFIDYDVLRFLSRTNAPLENASIDLKNNDLKINGIPNIFVSDSQNVAIIPKDESIIMKHNRSFQFDGTVFAGLFTFYGKNFFFNYDEFKITLKNVDSVRIKVIVGLDNYDKPIYQEVKNVIQDVTGDVMVDKPDNKSGIKRNAEYPIFHSLGNSYVYYDALNIFRGVYARSKDFLFKIDPYTLDSLDNFTKESMKFEGQFFSAKILPTIPESLMLQPDFSLGFTHIAPSEGFPLFQGKGKFFNKINLSNNGLRGDGNVRYLTSSINSKDILFFPDSMNTTAPEFTINASASGIQYPKVDGRDIDVHWTPYLDKMTLKNKSKPFQMFNSETTLSGSLTLQPKGLSGKGTMDLTSAITSSNLYTYTYNTIDADTAAFNIRSVHNEKYAVVMKNVKSHIDFGSRTGTFKSNNRDTVTEFPVDKYVAQVEEFKWKMDKKELDLLSSRLNEPSAAGLKYGFKDKQLTGATFTSVKHGQDSLNFVSPLAVYDYANDIIRATQVQYIEVADARVFPYNGNVVIEAEAKMQPFVNAKIMANTETRFHNIYQAEVNIEGKLKYSGKGKYDYIDENNKVQTIVFNNIGVDTAFHTIAEGNLTEPDEFTLNPNFKYQGKVFLKSAEKFLNFNGAVHIVDTCPNYGRSWVNFESAIDPLNVDIPVSDKLVELNRRPIMLGTIITTDSIHIYSSFFGTRKNYSDSTIGTSKGFLRFNKDSSTYLVASKEKMKTPALPQSLVALNRKKCIHYDEGKLNLGVDFGQFKLTTAGNVQHNLNKNQVNLRVMMALDFFMLDKSMESMALMVDSLTTKKQPVEITLGHYKKVLGSLIEPDVLNKYYTELATSGKPKDLPRPMTKTIFLNDVRLVWDDVSNSYRSIGKIGIGTVYKRQINKYVEGYIEIWRKRSGDIFDIYLKLDEKTFYYFGYTRGVMQVVSSDNTGFNDPIKTLKDSQRQLEVARNQTPYSFLISTERKMMLVRKRWLNKDEKPEEQVEEQPVIQAPVQKADSLKEEPAKTNDKPEQK